MARGESEARGAAARRRRPAVSLPAMRLAYSISKYRVLERKVRLTLAQGSPGPNLLRASNGLQNIEFREDYGAASKGA